MHSDTLSPTIAMKRFPLVVEEDENVILPLRMTLQLHSQSRYKYDQVEAEFMLLLSFIAPYINKALRNLVVL